MKTICIVIEDKIFDDLNSLMTHRGQRTYLLRKKIVDLVNELKEERKIETCTKCGTQDG